jgi:hypothetical protein
MSEKNGGSLEVEGFGLRTRVRGHDVIVVILVLVVMFGLGFLLWQHDRDTAVIHAELAANQKALAEHMEDMLYVLSLSETDRQKLNLAMPDSLRKRKRRGEDDR